MIAGLLIATAVSTQLGSVLSASPSRVEIVGAGSRTVHIGPVRQPLRIETAVGGYRLDLRGRPHVAGVLDAARWLTVRPRYLLLGRSGGLVTVSASPPRRAAAGDHEALVLLTARIRSSAGILMRMRVGVVVEVRVPGRIVRRLVVSGVRVVRTRASRKLSVTLVNRGNVRETLRRGDLVVVVRRAGRIVARLRAGPRDVLPHARALVELPCRGLRRGRVSVQVWARRFVLRL